MTSSPPAEMSVPATRVRWIIFALACGASWFLYLHRYTWNIVSVELKEQHGWSQSELQNAYTFFSMTYGLGQLPSGLLCDFLGTHYFLAAIIALWSVATPFFFVSPSLWAICAARLSFGVAQAGCYPSLAKVTQVWFPPSYRTTIQGWMATFCGRGGGAMSSIILGSLLMGYCGLGLSISLWILAGAGVLFSGVFLWQFRSRPEDDPRVNAAELAHIQEGRQESSTTQKRLTLPWREALRSPVLWFLMLQQMLVAGADTMFNSLTGLYFKSRGVDIAQIGWLASLPLWGGAIGGMLGGMVNDALLQGQRRRLIRLTILQGCVLASFVSLTDWMIGQRTWQIGASRLGLGLVLGTVGGALLGSVLSLLGGRRRWCRSVLGCLGCFVACGMMFLVLEQETALSAGLVLFTAKFFADTQQPTQWGACSDVGGRFTATVFALINLAGNVGGVIFPPIYGYLLEWNTATVDGRSVTSYGPLFFLLSCMYLTGALCWLMADTSRTLESQTPETAG